MTREVARKKLRDVDPPILKKTRGRWPKKTAKKSRIWTPLPFRNLREVTPQKCKNSKTIFLWEVARNK